jgi:hypothetical protein
MTTSYVSPFTGNVIQPTDVSYTSIDLNGDTVQLYWPQYANASQQVATRIMDVFTDSDGTLVLPDATQASLGQDILIRNISGSSFTVTSFGGDASFTITTGNAAYVYLTDNTDQAGTWGVVAYGAGTSYADAATLAGNSTAALIGKLEVSLHTSEYTTAPLITEASRGNCHVWTGGAGTWTLPAVSTLGEGWFILVRNNGTGALTIQTSAVGSLIDGLVNIILPLGDSCIICVDREPSKQDFFTVGRARTNSLTFSSATYDVDTVAGSTLSLISNTPIIQRYTALSGSRTTSLTVTLPAVTQVYYLLNDTNQSSYNMLFQVQGSSQPPYSLPNSTQAIVLSDGNNIYPLIQSNIGQLIVNPGTAASPAFTFFYDPSSGMYSPNPSQLGFSVGGQDILILDGTGGVGNFVSTFIGRLNATLISGGSF